LRAPHCAASRLPDIAVERRARRTKCSAAYRPSAATAEDRAAPTAATAEDGAASTAAESTAADGGAAAATAATSMLGIRNRRPKRDQRCRRDQS
jgi:hypothetical protein